MLLKEAHESMGTFLVNGFVFTPAISNNSSFDNNFSVEKPNADAKETKLAPLTSANGLRFKLTDSASAH